MTETVLRMLRLIGAEINPDLQISEPISFSEGEMEALVRIAKQHSLAHLFAAALERRGILGEDASSQVLRQEMLLAVYRQQQRAVALEEVGRAFDAAKIFYLPLKGAVLAYYYPAPWMRSSCDIDVLVSRDDLSAATAALTEGLSYECKGEASHDVSFYSPSGVHLELHFDLVEEGRAQNAADLLSRVWSLVQASPDAYACRLPDEMFYFYHIAHMAKHLELGGGCGARSFLDLWILEHRIPHDAQKRERLLQEGGLLRFARTARQLSEVWFGGEEADRESLLLQDFLLRGGAYGSVENRIAVEQGRRGGRVRFLLSRIFLPYDRLRYRYPVLKKHRWLFPVFQLVRWCSLPFQGRLHRSVKELRRSGSMTPEQLQRSEEAMRAFGLK